MSDCFTLLNLASFLNRVFHNPGNLRCSAFATATFTPNPSQTYLSVSSSLNITQHLPHLCPCSGYCQKCCCSSVLFKAKPLHLWLVWSTWSLKPPSLKPTITLPWCPVALLVDVTVWDLYPSPLCCGISDFSLTLPPNLWPVHGRGLCPSYSVPLTVYKYSWSPRIFCYCNQRRIVVLMVEFQWGFRKRRCF